MFEWAYSGANKAVPRNVGPECAYFLSPQRQIVETLVVTSISIYVMAEYNWTYIHGKDPTNTQLVLRYSSYKLGTGFFTGFMLEVAIFCCYLRQIVPILHYYIIKTYPKLQIHEDINYIKNDRGGKRLLVILLALLWGMEIGFKFASRTVIYLLNPCHVTTLIQIYLLAAPPSKMVTALFRIHLNLLNGPLLAFLFPETASRTILAEAALYWIQHGMMFVIPYYLLRIGGVYNVEPLWDFNWAIFSYSLNMIYHFIILQIIAIPAQVNLNHMLCPAILDPFDGPWYRIAAVTHQALLCPLLCKFFCIVAEFCLTKFPPTKVKPYMKDSLRDAKQLNQPLIDQHND